MARMWSSQNPRASRLGDGAAESLQVNEARRSGAACAAREKWCTGPLKTHTGDLLVTAQAWKQVGRPLTGEWTSCSEFKRRGATQQSSKNRERITVVCNKKKESPNIMLMKRSCQKRPQTEGFHSSEGQRQAELT